MPLRIEEKLAFTLLTVVSAIAFSWNVNILLAFSLLVLRKAIRSLRPHSDESARRFRKFFRYFLLLSGFMVLVNGFLMRGGEIVWSILSIPLFKDGLIFGLETSSRLLVLVISLLIFFGSTPMKDIAAFLHRIGLPAQLVMTLLLTLHFLDQLPARIERIFEAQEARGAPVRSSRFGRIKSLFAVFTPLILSSIVESIDRGTALELRGFHSKAKLQFQGSEPAREGTTPLTWILLLLSACCSLWIILRRFLP